MKRISKLCQQCKKEEHLARYWGKPTQVSESECQCCRAKHLIENVKEGEEE